MFLHSRQLATTNRQRVHIIVAMKGTTVDLTLREERAQGYAILATMVEVNKV